MTDYLTEQEQIELLKKWLKQYALVIIAGIVIAIALVTGWRYWQERQLKMLSHASMVYDEMLSLRAQNDPAAAYTQAQKLISHYPKTIYSQIASLMIARDDIVKGDYAKAKASLTTLIDNSKLASFRQIARLRLARVFLAENKPQESLDVLKKIEDKSYVGLIEELNGDAYLAMGDKAKAREAYQNALTELPNAEIVRPLLRMKFDNLNS